MLTSIKKYTKSFLAKVLIFIIILPFVFWGMGDVFRSGNQNIVATIGSEKISAQDFFNYVQSINLNDEQRKNLNKSDLLDKILSSYISKKVISLEVESLGIQLTDKSLREIIISDETFFKDNKFSRTTYEKFLLESGITAPGFEENIVEQEKKRQLLTYLSEGIVIPEFLIENSFREENQIKNIKYIDLNNFYKNKKIDKNEISKIYEKNKKFFVQKFKVIQFVELTPNKLTGNEDYGENYFQIINKIENDLLDGKNINEIVKQYDLSLSKTEEVNVNKLNSTGIKIKNIDDELFKKIYNKKINEPELSIIGNKYFLTVVSSEKNVDRKLEDKEVQESVTAQLRIKNIIENNGKIGKQISNGKFNENEMKKYAQENNLEIKSVIIKSIENNDIFSENIIKQIFKLKNKEITVVTNSMLNDNFIIYVEKTEKKPFDKNSKDYDKYRAKAKLVLSDKVYQIYDVGMNSKYKIDVNQKVLNRIKNTL